jgi:translocation and assembly module TamB
MNVDSPKKTTKTRNDKPRVKTWKVVLGLLLVLPFVAVQWLLHSSFFVRVVIDRVEVALPGLEIEVLSGSIAEGLRLNAYYTDQQNRYAIKDLNIAVSLTCLLRKRLCIDHLQIAEMEIALTSSVAEPTQPAPIQLPTIVLPIDLSVDTLTIQSLRVLSNGQPAYAVAGIQSVLSLTGSELKIEKFSAADAYCQWQIAAVVDLFDNYPINANIFCQSTEQFGNVELSLSQSIANLKVTGILAPQQDALKPVVLEPDTYIAVELAIQPLRPELPISLTASLQNPTQIQLNEDKLSIARAELVVNSEDFEADLQLNGALSHSRWPGNHQFASTAHLQRQSLDLQSFAWQLPDGHVNASGELQFNDGLHWAGQIELQDVALDAWQTLVTGKLSSKLLTELNYANEELIASVKIEELNGTVNQQSLSGLGQLRWQDQQLHTSQTQLRIGGSDISLDGTASVDSVDLRTRFSIPELQIWLPEAQGSVNGQLHVQGAYTDPQISGVVNVRSIEYQSIKTETLVATINWQGMESSSNRIDLQANSIQQQDFFGNATLIWQGSIADHQWQLTGRGLNQHADKQLATRCGGSWTAPVIEARCDQVNINFDYFDDSQQWSLSSPMQFSLNTHAQHLSLTAFCLTNGNQSICNNENVALTPQSTDKLTIQARNLSASWIAPWLPKNAGIEGKWNATFSVENPFTQLVLAANLDSESIVVQWQQAEQAPLALQIPALHAAWVWQQEKQHHQLEWTFVTRNNGSSGGNIALAGEQISGQFNLRQWQLSAFSGFVLQQPRDKIEGLVNSDFELSGTVNNPLLNGKMTINDGLVKTAALPVPIEKININLQVDDNNANLSGRFVANESEGTLGGELFWSPEQWHADLSLAAQDLAYKPDANIQVFVSPDVNLKLSPQQVTLTGTVQVPRADVEIEQLPEQAVSISPDTIIIGNEKPAQTQQQVTTNLKLVLGENVRFTGFGLETRVTGNLNIQQRPGELLRGQGVLQLKEGRYKAYGQDLRIRNGDLVFVNDIENPQLRMEAIREPLKTADDVIVGLRVSGAARDPAIALFSEPPMTQQEQMSYMISGVAPGVDKETDPTQLAAQSALSYALNSKAGEGLTQFAGKALGIDDFQVTTDSNEEGTHIGLSGYITPRLLVQYGVGVFDSVNSLTLKYQLKKNLYLEAISGKGNSVGLLWSFEKD